MASEARALPRGRDPPPESAAEHSPTRRVHSGATRGAPVRSPGRGRPSGRERGNGLAIDGASGQRPRRIDCEAHETESCDLAGRRADIGAPRRIRLRGRVRGDRARGFPLRRDQRARARRRAGAAAGGVPGALHGAAGWPAGHANLVVMARLPDELPLSIHGARAVGLTRHPPLAAGAFRSRPTVLAPCATLACRGKPRQATDSIGSQPGPAAARAELA